MSDKYIRIFITYIMQNIIKNIKIKESISFYNSIKLANMSVLVSKELFPLDKHNQRLIDLVAPGK